MAENIGEIHVVIDDGDGGGGAGGGGMGTGGIGDTSPNALAALGRKGGRSEFAQQVLNSMYNEAARLAKPPPPPVSGLGTGAAAAGGAASGMLSAAGPLVALAAAAGAVALAFNRVKRTIEGWNESLRASEARFKGFSFDVAQASAGSKMAEINRTAEAARQFGGTVANSIRARTASENAWAPLNNALDRAKAALSGEFYNALTMSAATMRDFASAGATAIEGLLKGASSAARSTFDFVSKLFGANIDGLTGGRGSVAAVQGQATAAMLVGAMLAPVDRIAKEVKEIRADLRNGADKAKADGSNQRYVDALRAMTAGRWGN